MSAGHVHRSEIGNGKHFRRAIALSAFLAAAAASFVAPVDARVAATRGVDTWSSGLPATSVRLEQELLSAREATERYRNLEDAIADGFVDTGLPYMPGMGYHYIRESRLDDQFVADQPEILVYAETGVGGALELVAVEYAVPLALSDSAPAGFTGNFDTWNRDEENGLWTLHAWVWLENRDGVFASHNPDVP